MEMALQSTRATLKNKKGLTLIELLAVLVIVGIIAAIAIPAINATIDRSKDKSDKASQQLLIDAALRYATEESLDNTSGDKLTTTPDKLKTAGYLSQVPTWNKSAHTITSIVIAFDNSTGIATVTLSPAEAVVK